MSKVFCALVFFVAVATASGFLVKRQDAEEETSTTISPPKCPPKPKTVENLDLEKYAGTWYQVLGLPSFFQPAGTRCIKATYAVTGNNSISVWNTNVRPDDSFSEICGSAELPDEGFGEFQVKFAFTPPGSNMIIVDTDYEDYACVYSCIDFPVVGKFEYAWVLTRVSAPPQETADTASDRTQQRVSQSIEQKVSQTIEVKETLPTTYNRTPYCLPLELSQPRTEKIEKGKEILKSNGVDVDKMEPIEQNDDCVYQKPDEENSCSKNL